MKGHESQMYPYLSFSETGIAKILSYSYLISVSVFILHSQSLSHFFSFIFYFDGKPNFHWEQMKKNTRVSRNIKPTRGSFTKELSQMKQNKSERIITKIFHPLIPTDKMRPDAGSLLSSKDFILPTSTTKQAKHPSLSQKSPFVWKGEWRRNSSIISL